MHMNRFAVFQLEEEWLVTYGDRTQLSFSSREDAEQSAFEAAGALAADGHAVSVLIIPSLLQNGIVRSGCSTQHARTADVEQSFPAAFAAGVGR